MSIYVNEREKIYFMVSDHYLSPIVMILSGLSPLSLGREGGYERLEFIVISSVVRRKDRIWRFNHIFISMRRHLHDDKDHFMRRQVFFLHNSFVGHLFLFLDE